MQASSVGTYATSWSKVDEEITPSTEEQCHFLEGDIATIVANTTAHPQTPLSPPILSNANLPKSTKPDNFTPRRNVDVKLWLFQMEQYLRSTNLPRERYVEYAVALFRGSTISWWRTLSHLGGIQRHHAHNFLPH